MSRETSRWSAECTALRPERPLPSTPSTKGSSCIPTPAADWVGVDETYRGHDGVRRYMAQVYEAFEDYRPEVEDLLVAGEKVVTLAIEHGRGRASGASGVAAYGPCLDDAREQGDPP